MGNYLMGLNGLPTAVIPLKIESSKHIIRPIKKLINFIKITCIRVKK